MKTGCILRLVIFHLVAYNAITAAQLTESSDEQLTETPEEELNDEEIADTSLSTPAQGQDNQSICSLSPLTGKCRASIPRFYYSTESKDCLEFMYGGCGANENNFVTYQQCLDVCVYNITTALDNEYEYAEDMENEVDAVVVENGDRTPRIRSLNVDYEKEVPVGTMVSLDKNVNSRLDFEEPDSSWTLDGFTVVSAADFGLENIAYNIGIKSALLQENSVGYISKNISLAKSSLFEIEFSLYVKETDGSQPNLTVALEPSESDSIEIFTLDPSINQGVWKRYRFMVEPEEDLSDTEVVIHAETSADSFIAVDDIFLSWRNILDIQSSNNTIFASNASSTTVGTGVGSSSPPTSSTSSATPSTTADTTLSSSESTSADMPESTSISPEASTLSTSSPEASPSSSVSTEASTSSGTQASTDNNETKPSEDGTHSLTDEDFNISVDIEKLAKQANGTVLVHHEFHIHQSSNFSIEIHVP